MGLILGHIQKHFALILQTATWLLLILTPFVIKPPFDNLPGDVEIWSKFIHFLLAALIALLLYPIIRFNLKKHIVVWWIVSAFMLGAGISLYWYYQVYLIPHKTVALRELERGKTLHVVIGDELTLDGKKIIAENQITIETLITYYSAGDDIETRINRYWSESDVASNGRLLLFCYVSIFVLLAGFIVTVIQSINLQLKLQTHEKQDNDSRHVPDDFVSTNRQSDADAC